MCKYIYTSHANLLYSISQKNVDSLFQYNVDELEKILHQYSGHILHPRHYLMIAVKRYLLYVYDHKNIPSRLQCSPYEMLAKKAEYAHDILMMYDIICPGITKERGLTLFELFSANFLMIKMDANDASNEHPTEKNVDQESSGNINMNNC